MAVLSKTDIVTKYNNTSTGLFKTGQSRGIGSDDQRALVIDIGDSVEFLTQSITTVAIAGSGPYSLTLDMTSISKKRFNASATISNDFTLILSNVTNMQVAILDFYCDAEIEITMPETPIDSLMQNNDLRWVSGVLTLPIGYYQMAITYNGSFFKVSCSDKFDTYASSDLDLVSASISAGTLTLDMNSQRQRCFSVASAASSAFTLALSNTTNARIFELNIPITGSVDITLPSDFRMDEVELYSGRYDNSGPLVLTLDGDTASQFQLVATYTGSVWLLKASESRYDNTNKL